MRIHKLISVVVILVSMITQCLASDDAASISGVDVPAVQELRVESTPFFKQDGDTLRQVLRVSFDLDKHQQQIRVRLVNEVEGWDQEKTFENVSAGRPLLEMEVPRITKEESVRVRIFIGDSEFEASGFIVHPERLWKIYIMPSVHFDNGYTDLQSESMLVNRQNLEIVLDWFDEYPDFVWNIESSMVAEDYLRSGSRPEEFMRYASAGRLGIQGFYGNHLTGISSGEELSRLIAFYDYLRRHGIESSMVSQNDVPTMVWTTPMILHEHGIRYMSHGYNRSRANHNQEMTNSVFYWESPDGSRVLSWKTTPYCQAQWLTGTQDEGCMDVTRDAVIRTVNGFNRRGDYPYDALLVHGAFYDNRPILRSIVEIPQEWNRTYAYPQLILSRGTEFFEYIEENFADQIPTLTGCGGSFWEDGVASSAYETAITRVAREELLTAEKIASLCSPSFQANLKNQFERAWRNLLLYNEHTWGAEYSVFSPFDEQTIGQWEVKKSYADTTAKLSSELLDHSLSEFAARIQVERDSVLVFNPSSWSRSEHMEFVNESGEVLNLHADSVPPMGYKVFPISQAKKTSERRSLSRTLENRFYKIEFDENTGAVASIYDKELERELIDSSQHGANAHIYVTGFTVDSANIDMEDKSKGAFYQYVRAYMMRSHDQSSALIVDESSTPSFRKMHRPGAQVMMITAAAPMTKTFESEVILYDDEKRIDFVNRMDKVANLEKESGYFVFPFAFENPEKRIEIPHGVMRPDIDQFGGAGRNWYSAQQFVTVSDDSAAVVWTALDSPLITLQDINRETYIDRLSIDNGHIYAYAFNNLWYTNYRAFQEGPLTFRFAMTSAKSVTDLDAKRFGESVHSPMSAMLINETAEGDSPDSHSFTQLKGDGVVLQAMRPARFLDGTVIRLREMNGESRSVQLLLDGIDFERVYLSNMGEDKLEELTVHAGVVEVPCRALGVTTLLLER